MAPHRIIIPTDLIFEILAWLPAKSVLRFKSVCKEWYNLIDSPVFINLHLKKSLEPDSRQNRSLICTRSLRTIIDDIHHLPNPTTKSADLPKDNKYSLYRSRSFVGSCNGLVCFNVFSSRHGPTCIDLCFVIYNPTTRTFKSIVPSSDKKWNHPCLTYGFGYDSEHDDYKIVVMSRMFLDDVRVYSLKADSWRFPTSPRRDSSGYIGEGVFANKTLHFIVYHPPVMDRHENDYCQIVRFDVVSEKWIDDLISLPNKSMNCLTFGELDGWLYLHDIDSRDVWIIEEYGSLSSSWKKLFHYLPQDLGWFYDFVARFKNGDASVLVQPSHVDNVPGPGLLLQRYDHEYRRQHDDNDRVIPIKIEWSRDEGKLALCIASLVTIPGSSSMNLQQIDEYQRSIMALDRSSCVVSIDDLE